MRDLVGVITGVVLMLFTEREDSPLVASAMRSDGSQARRWDPGRFLLRTITGALLARVRGIIASELAWLARAATVGVRRVLASKARMSVFFVPDVCGAVNQMAAGTRPAIIFRARIVSA